MNGDTTADVCDLIERLRQQGDSARIALLDRVHERLRRIAAGMLHKEFPRLRDRHDVNSVVDESWIRLMKSLEEIRPASAEEFYSLIFHRVRQVLLDMARRLDRDDNRWRQPPAGASGSDRAAPFDVDTNNHDPTRLAFWTEFHREVASLPDEERIIFDFHYYAELSQAQIARLLNLHPKQVSRTWLAATGRLALWLDGCEDLLT